MFSTSNSIIYNLKRSTPISHRAPSPLPAPRLQTWPFPLLQPQASLLTPDDTPGVCWSGCCPPDPHMMALLPPGCCSGTHPPPRPRQDPSGSCTRSRLRRTGVSSIKAPKTVNCYRNQVNVWGEAGTPAVCGVPWVIPQQLCSFLTLKLSRAHTCLLMMLSCFMHGTGKCVLFVHRLQFYPLFALCSFKLFQTGLELPKLQKATLG